MDQLLRARKMGSASARRMRSHDRERAAQQAEDRRVRRLLYGYSSDENASSDDDNAPTFSPIIDENEDERSASASEDDSPHRRPDNVRDPLSRKHFMINVEAPKMDGEHGKTQRGRKTEVSQNDSRSMLTTPQSSMLNRDPTIVDADDESTINYHNDLSGAEDDFNPPPSPGIPHTAKSIQYLTPMARPSIVSIRSSISLYPLRTSSLDDHLPQAPPLLTPPPRSAKRLSRMSLVPDLVGSDYTSSQTSPQSSSEELGYTKTRGTASATPSTIPEEAQLNLRSARMSSARTPSFTRPKTSPDDEEHAGNSHVDRAKPGPDTSTSRTSSVEAKTTLTHPRLSRHFTLETVPRTASALQSAAVPVNPVKVPPKSPVALPRAHTQPIVSAPSGDAKTLSRKKSLSGLRSRSESIGKAIRSASSLSKARGRFPVVPASTSPPVPDIHPDLKRMGSDINITDVKQAARNSDKSSQHSLGLRNMGPRVAMSAR